MSYQKCEKNRVLKSKTFVFLLSVFLLSGTSALANPDAWKNQFKGALTFELKDDAKLAQLNKRVRKLKRELESASISAKAQKDVVEKLKTKKQNLEAKIKKLKAQIVNSEKMKVELSGKIPGLETQLATIIVELKGKNKAYKKALANLEKEKAKIEPIKVALVEARKQLQLENTPENKKKVKQLTSKLKQQKAKVAAARKIEADAKKAVQVVKTKKKKVATRIENINKKIAALDTKIAKAKQALQGLPAKLANTVKKLQKERGILKPLVQQKKQAEQKFTKVKNRRKQYRQKLIDNILDYNRRGLRIGRGDGSDDGYDLALKRGQRYGDRDGSSDGSSDGTTAGKNRDYKRGYDVGEVIGAERAETVGSANGKSQGTYQGNVDAAEVAGRKNGTIRANNSDAAIVGQKQGKKAGLDRAVTTGDRVGTDMGEKQAIAKFEEATLQSVTVDGAFIGSFASSVPSFPQGHTGRNYDPYSGAGYGSQLINKSYVAGYIYTYKRTVRRKYLDSIDNIYENAYESSYSYSYQEHYSRDYPSYYDSGQSAGETYAYNRDYQMHYDNAYSAYREMFAVNPNVNSTEYKQTYKSIEAQTYARVYENIRYDNFVATEAMTFQANIEEQTEKYRVARFKAVKKVYKNNPVLDFVGSEMIDGGINGVAKADGVYQPLENTIHNITVKNFGVKPAKNVVIKMNSGESYKMPSIPPKSEVAIKGAVKGQVGNLNEGDRFRSILTMFSPLTAEAKIQGRHYYNTDSDQVNGGDIKRITVKYPLKLTGLKSIGTVVLGKEVPLEVTVINESQRNYEDGMLVELTVNSLTPIIFKEFAPVDKVERTIKLGDARILVTDERDSYTPLSFTAKISKRGVMLGKFAGSFTTVAKAAYVKKEGLAVVFGNYNQAPEDFLDVISNFGGVNEVSVIDTSVAENAQIMANESLTGKTIIVIERGTQSLLDTIIKNATNSVLLVPGDKDVFKKITKLPSFKNSHQFNFKIGGVGRKIPFAFTYVNTPEAVASQLGNTAIRTSLRDYQSLLGVADLLKLSNDALLEKIKTDVDSSSYFVEGSEAQQVMQVATIRSIDEVTKVDRIYRVNGDRNAARTLRSFGKYFHQKLVPLVYPNSADDSNVSLYMFAQDYHNTMKNAVGYYDPIEDKLKINTGRYFKEGSKKLSRVYKKYDRSLRKKVEKKKGITAPFKLAQESNWDDDVWW